MEKVSDSHYVINLDAKDCWDLTDINQRRMVLSLTHLILKDTLGNKTIVHLNGYPHNAPISMDNGYWIKHYSIDGSEDDRRFSDSNIIPGFPEEDHIQNFEKVARFQLVVNDTSVEND